MPISPIVYRDRPCFCPTPMQIVQRLLGPIVAKILKITLYRETALQGRCAKYFITPLLNAIVKLWMKTQGIPIQGGLNTKRLTKSAQFLSEFTEMRTLTTEDGITLQWALFTPQKFNQWIESHGGVREGEWIRPKTPQDWQQLQNLRAFKCFEESGEAFRVPRAIPQAHAKCVLRCQGFGRKIPMDKSLIGLHLAAGFNYAVFDWRNDTLLSKSFKDAEAVYQALLREGYSPRAIKPMGVCRANFVIGRLKELHHQEGLDVVMIQSPTSLRSAISQTTWPANRLGLMGLNYFENKGEDYDTLRKLRSLSPAESAICLIMSEGDKTLAPTTISDLNAAASAIGPCELIIEPKKEGVADPHFAEPLRDPMILEKYFQFLVR